MTDLRAVWRKTVGDSYGDLTSNGWEAIDRLTGKLLDDLEAIDRERMLDPAAILPPDSLAWVQAHPEDLEALLGMGPLSAGDIAAARKKLAALPYGPEQAELVARLEEERAAQITPAEAAQANPAVPARVKPPAPAKPATARAATRRRTRT